MHIFISIVVLTHVEMVTVFIIFILQNIPEAKDAILRSHFIAVAIQDLPISCVDNDASAPWVCHACIDVVYVLVCVLHYYQCIHLIE